MKIFIAIFMCFFLIGCSKIQEKEEREQQAEQRRRDREFDEKNRRRDINIFETDEPEIKVPLPFHRPTTTSPPVGYNVMVYLKRNQSHNWQWHLKEKCTCCVDLFDVKNELKMNELGDYINYTKFDFVGCRPGKMVFEYYRDDSTGRKIDRTVTVILERKNEKNE